MSNFAKQHGRLASTLVVLLSMVVLVPQITHAQTAVSCNEQAALINYRAKLLAAYKKKNDRSYKTTRSLWAGRIAYASQWLTVEAEQARDNLYRFDNLHAATNAEIDAQIAAYGGYLTRPLQCADQKTKIAQVYKTMVGTAGNAQKTGDARIKELRLKERAFENGPFKKTNTKLIDALHKAKKKHPAPIYPALTIKDSAQ